MNFGLIGASTIAREWMIPAINAQPNAAVTAVMSSSSERGANYASKNGIPNSYDNLDALLADDIDAVYISTTNELHKDQLLAAVAAGKHVICEKPLALTLDDAKLMVAESAKQGVVMATNHHLRNAVTHRMLRKLIREGAVGRPLAARVFHAVYLPEHLQTWRIKDPATGAGVILDITVHDTDTLRFVLDSEVTEVVAHSTNQGMSVEGLEDSVMGVMHFENGVIAQFHDDFNVPHASTGLEVHGTEGSLIARDVMTQQPIGTIHMRKAGEEHLLDPGPPENLYERSVARFIAAVNGTDSPAATGEDGIRSLAVGLAVLESCKTGRRVSVSY